MAPGSEGLAPINVSIAVALILAHDDWVEKEDIAWDLLSECLLKPPAPDIFKRAFVALVKKIFKRAKKREKRRATHRERTNKNHSSSTASQGAPNAPPRDSASATVQGRTELSQERESSSRANSSQLRFSFRDKVHHLCRSLVTRAYPPELRVEPKQVRRVRGHDAQESIDVHDDDGRDPLDAQLHPHSSRFVESSSEDENEDENENEDGVSTAADATVAVATTAALRHQTQADRGQHTRDDPPTRTERGQGHPNPHKRAKRSHAAASATTMQRERHEHDSSVASERQATKTGKRKRRKAKKAVSM